MKTSIQKKLNLFVNGENKLYGENLDAANQALQLIEDGVAENDILVNMEPGYGVTCAMSIDEFKSDGFWPEDWDVDINDMTNLDEWCDDMIKNFYK